MSAAAAKNREEEAVMKTSNLNLQERKKEGNKSVHKRWTSIDSKDNDSNNAHHFSVIKLPQIGKGLSFDVGDCWPANINGVASLYRVISVEDIIIPAGRYRCYKISEEMKGRGMNFYWFASEIGLIKWEIEGAKGVLKDLSYDDLS